ncbi:hypothetical protein J6590_033018 [Homalodisca vitripennis]|nr:hypothetical protein J6590_033018 [Homalodisca vitripennis]
MPVLVPSSVADEEIPVLLPCSVVEEDMPVLVPSCVTERPVDYETTVAADGWTVEHILVDIINALNTSCLLQRTRPDQYYCVLCSEIETN